MALTTDAYKRHRNDPIDREYKEADGGCAPRLMSKHGWSPDPGGPMAPTTFGLVGRAL
jgi:hypothetical protein